MLQYKQINIFITSHFGNNICVGRDCFSGVFVVNFSSSILGFLALTLLLRKQKKSKGNRRWFKKYQLKSRLINISKFLLSAKPGDNFYLRMLLSFTRARELSESIFFYFGVSPTTLIKGNIKKKPLDVQTDLQY